MMTLIFTIVVFTVIAIALCAILRRILTVLDAQEPWISVAYASVCLLLLMCFLSEIGWLTEPHAWRTR